jgi:hypothetical protein
VAPLYFVVWRRAGAETPSLYHDHLPGWIHGKHAAARGLVYMLRLDTLPDAERWVAMGLDELWRHYCRLRDKGRLPVPGGAAAPTVSRETKDPASDGGSLVGPIADL